MDYWRIFWSSESPRYAFPGLCYQGVYILAKYSPPLGSHLVQSKQVISKDAAILPRKLDWMVTDRMDDLKGLMHDNSTFIQFPPIGSSASLITVLGEHRVNVQRTIRSIMQLVINQSSISKPLTLTSPAGMPVLRCFLVASPGSVQRSHPFHDLKPDTSLRHPQADLVRYRCRGCIQGHVLRNAWT